MQSRESTSADDAGRDALAQRLRIGISGSYGGLNLGDEAILQGIIAQLRRTLSADIIVFSRDPDDTRKRHDVERAVAVRSLGRNEIIPEIQALDLLIIGGGGILFDDEARIFLREAAIAQELGVPVAIYAVSAGPLEDPTAQRVVRDVLSRADLVTVRDKFARRILEEVGLQREIIVTADPALLLEPEPLPADALTREGLDGKRRLVAMSVRERGGAAPDLSEEHYHALLANAADFMVDRYDADIVFVPIERQMLDLQQAHAVMARMLRPQHAAVLQGQYTAGQMVSLMGRFDFAVGMRLHFLIFAALQRVPFVALPYAAKVSGFLDELHLATPPLRQVNAGRLIAHIDKSWDQRRQLRKHIETALPRLKAAALETNRHIVQLLAERAAAAGRRE